MKYICKKFINHQGLSPYSTRRAKHDGRSMQFAFERNGCRMSDRFRAREESADF